MRRLVLLPRARSISPMLQLVGVGSALAAGLDGGLQFPRPGLRPRRCGSARLSSAAWCRLRSFSAASRGQPLVREQRRVSGFPLVRSELPALSPRAESSSSGGGTAPALGRGAVWRSASVGGGFRGAGGQLGLLNRADPPPAPAAAPRLWRRTVGHRPAEPVHLQAEARSRSAAAVMLSAVGAGQLGLAGYPPPPCGHGRPGRHHRPGRAFRPDSVSRVRSSSSSCLRLNTPTLRAVEPPVKELPPALMTWPSSVTIRLR